MISTYDDYLASPKSLAIDEMQRLHRELVGELDDADAKELYDELVKTATRYARFRGEWPLMSKSEKMEIDDRRTSCHNSVITKFNMLARYLKSIGKEARWRDALGYEEDDRINRKSIGDFACYIVFINSLNSR